ncbi:hypothetical protein NDU88_003110 [Pleurodeles waltl]|uniref:Secreted protein n=1 Tax=Pleurodeles waltl TaxID=8319 RepID=A0AAV7UZP7_PLEWA|nr:hypothetical protein NDU88_003110 [Pleurodeles waltl]
MRCGLVWCCALLRSAERSIGFAGAGIGPGAREGVTPKPAGSPRATSEWRKVSRWSIGAMPWCAPVGTSELPRVSSEQGRGPRKAWCSLGWCWAHLRSAEWCIGTADEGNGPGTREGGRPQTSGESTNCIGVAEGEPLEHRRENVGGTCGDIRTAESIPSTQQRPRGAVRTRDLQMRGTVPARGRGWLPDQRAVHEPHRSDGR